MTKFSPHYRLTVQKDNDIDWEGPCGKLPGERNAAGDEFALRAAIAMAQDLSVGADGRCEFGGYTVYVNYCESFGSDELLATVARAYSFDNSSDYTFATNHCGHIDAAMHSRVAAELGA